MSSAWNIHCDFLVMNVSKTSSVSEKRPLTSPLSPSPVHKIHKMGTPSPQASSSTEMTASDPGSITMEKMFDLLLSVKKGQDSLRQLFDKKIDKLKNEVLSTIDDKIKAVKVDVDLHMASVDSRIEALEACMKQEMPDRVPPDPLTNPDLCVIVSGLRYSDSENIAEKVTNMLSKLGETVAHIKPVKCGRLKSRDPAKPGLVKIAFGTLDDKVAILRAKLKLRDTIEYRRVWIRSSKCHTDRLLELNFLAVLDMIPGGDQYRLTGSGRIIKRDETYDTEMQDTASTGTYVTDPAEVASGDNPWRYPRGNQHPRRGQGRPLQSRGHRGRRGHFVHGQTFNQYNSA